ncbi:M24 family metallopeptidase [Niveibacterium terrae]|uniref:M24 family metallopeptidase n=1 Tax=Niveibacterium terrae TaxID=3373598 RepID=UPI003A8D1D44
MTSAIPSRLAALRAAMAEQGVSACLILSSDPHLSEYLPDHWQGRQWISGFTGSVGTFIATADFAGVWVDSRYWVQAEAQLAGTGITLMKVETGISSRHVDWLAETLASGAVVAVDGDCLGLAAAKQLGDALGAKDISLRTDLDLLDAIWADRPGLPAAPVRAHDLPHAVVARGDKLANLRAELAGKGADHHFLSTLDDICWIFNLRGADVSFNPVFLAHALIAPDSATLFVGAGKIGSALQAELARVGVRVAPYEDAAAALAALPATARLLVDPRRITFGLRQAVADGVAVIEAINPSTLAKSRKDNGEAVFVREAMEADGAAMSNFYAAFEAALARGERVTECDVDERITAERLKQPGCIGASFGTIAGFNANGAMPHYHATPESDTVIAGNGLLLIDSGGQYLGGTTDITRVWAIGHVSAEQKRDFTLVLKGTMGLSRARFPLGTPGPMLDSLARAPIWAASVEYGHGTGHGVGYFLAVHEGPQTISKAIPTPEMAMLPGMITSVEPGIYRPGQWGVRIENLVLNVAAPDAGFGDFLEFETLTLCPIDTRCIARELLNEDERAWLNGYHAEVFRRVSPRVTGASLEWLRERTAAI